MPKTCGGLRTNMKMFCGRVGLMNAFEAKPAGPPTVLCLRSECVRPRVGESGGTDRIVALEAALRIESVEPEVGDGRLACRGVDSRQAVIDRRVVGGDGEVEDQAELIGGKSCTEGLLKLRQVRLEVDFARSLEPLSASVEFSSLAVALGFGERCGEQVPAVLNDLAKRVFSFEKFVFVDPFESIREGWVLSRGKTLLGLRWEGPGRAQIARASPATARRRIGRSPRE